MKITIDGISYDTDNEQLVQAIQKYQKDQEEKMKKQNEKMKKEKEEDEEEIKKLKKEKDKTEGERDAALKSKMDDKALNELINKRAKLFQEAKDVLGDKFLEECDNCPKEIKVAVIDKILNLGDLSKKSDEYIDGVYDTAIQNAKNSKKSLDKFGKDLLDKDKDKMTRDSVREDYEKKMLNPDYKKGE